MRRDFRWPGLIRTGPNASEIAPQPPSPPVPGSLISFRGSLGSLPVSAEVPEEPPAAHLAHLANECRGGPPHSSGETPSPEPPRLTTCCRCDATLFIESDLLCPTCYQARRAPGRLLPFAPGRRTRALERLAGRPCPDCLTTDWHVSPRGDATCQTCARGRAVSTADGTNVVPPGGAA